MPSNSDPIDSPEPFLIRYKGELSLLAMISGLIITIILGNGQGNVLWLILQTGFEAGTVGGTADWLAVKMIFDEIRIGKFKIVPASGIIPRKQKAIARGAGKLVSEEWLSPESIKPFLQQLNVASALAGYLKQFRTTEDFKKLSIWIAENLISLFDRPDFQKAVESWVKKSLVGLKPVNRISRKLEDTHLKSILDQVISPLSDGLCDVLLSPEVQALLRNKIAEEQGFLAKLFFDADALSEKILVKLTSAIREIESDEFHPVRELILTKASGWKNELAQKEENSLDEWFGRTIADYDFQEDVRSILEKLKSDLREAIFSREQDILKFAESLAGTLITRLESDEDLQKLINGKFYEIAASYLADNHHQIAGLVESNINRLSVDEIKEQFRSRTYDDMQWIRVNGAVAGFVIGIVIGVIRVSINV